MNANDLFCGNYLLITLARSTTPTLSQWVWPSDFPEQTARRGEDDPYKTSEYMEKLPLSLQPGSICIANRIDIPKLL